MSPKPIVHKILLLIFIFLISATSAQESARYIFIENAEYQYFDYLINAGYLSPHFVFQQPYDAGILDEVKETARGLNYYQNYWNSLYGQNHIGGFLSGSDKLKYQNRQDVNRFSISGGPVFNFPYLSLANRTTLDQEYKYDPLYAGDLSEADNWIYGRTSDAYININFKNFDLFFGRIQRNWGLPDEHSLILSNNPYSYDHLLFSYRNKFFKLSLIFAQLENLSAKSIPNLQKPDSVITHRNTRKFLVGHRLDIHVSDNFQLALTEMATYGGKDRDVEYSFFNPMTYFYGLQRNDKKQMNGLWALDVFYKPYDRLSFYSQFLIDDIVVNNEPDINDRDRVPDRLGLMASLRSGDLPLRGINTSLTYVRIWNRTYQSKLTWENYHYRELGLGYPCASCEELKFKFGYWGFFPLYFHNEVTIGRYGGIQLTDIIPLRKEEFPIEPVTENIADLFSIRYFPNRFMNLFLTLSWFRDSDHYLNRLNEESETTISVGVNLFINGKFDIK